MSKGSCVLLAAACGGCVTKKQQSSLHAQAQPGEGQLWHSAQRRHLGHSSVLYPTCSLSKSYSHHYLYAVFRLYLLDYNKNYDFHSQAI